MQLTTVCNQNREHHRLIHDISSRMGIKWDGPENRVSMNIATETIPRKAKGKRRDRTPAAASSAARGGNANGAKGEGCTLCKKYCVFGVN